MLQPATQPTNAAQTGVMHAHIHEIMAGMQAQFTQYQNTLNHALMPQIPPRPHMEFTQFQP